MTRWDALCSAAAVAGLALALSSCQDGRPARPAGKTVGIPSGIAFSFGGRIHLMRPDGLRRQRLTGGRPAGHGAGDVQAAWAPDGRRLAFVRTSKPSPDRSRIYLLDVAGGRATALTPGGRQIQSIDPAWSPDGRQIAYTRWNSRGEVGENAIVVAQADGSGERVLRRVGLDGQPDVMGQPAWSPDGAQILYTRYTTDRRHNFRPSLHVMDAATGDSRPLAGDAADGAWSPDGRRIAFSGVRDGNGKWCYEQCFISGEIYVMESDGTNLERLTRNRGNDAAPSWSPDGSRIVFESNRNVRDAPPSQGTEIYSIRADGSCLTWLTNGSPSSGDPAWRGSAFSPAQVGACGPVRRPPLVDVDVEALRASDRHPAYWLGNRHGSLLLGSAQGYEVGRRSLRTYAFFYDDCALYDVRSCRRGLQLQEDSVCSRQTTLAALARPHYRGGIAWRHGGRLLVSVGRDVVRVLTGGTQVTIFSQDEGGGGTRRPRLLAAVHALRQLGRPRKALPPPALPRELLAELDRAQLSHARTGSIAAAADQLGLTTGQTRRRLRLARALDALPQVGTARCPRR